ncbi:YhgE/Pip family protein [Salimicrobium sp. PL1-032A]|uniref:YhgE/Pip family protein n=1 Tax=Salimicrobium sp. PL1-032A TaxID=3095364 RepID=UPI003260FA76
MAFRIGRRSGAGLKDGDYFLTVTIPETFSGQAVTVFDDSPEEPRLIYNTNPGYSMTGEIIAGQGSRQVTEEVSKELQSAYTDVWSKAITDMRSGLSENEDELAAMQERLSELQAASEELTSGLEAAAPSVASQAGQLSSSISELKEGIRQLKEAQAEALEETGDLHLAEENTSTFLEPIEINEKSMTEVENYGSGFTPYILSISLFIGAIAFHVFYKTNDMLNAGVRGWFGKFGVVLFQGVMQALIAAFVLDVIMNVGIENRWMFYGMTIATSLTFMMAVTLFVSAFGNIGRFLAVLLLVVQIGTSAGTFPIELSGKLFRTLHEFSPMTYSIKGFREAMFDFTGSIAPGEIFFILGGLASILALLWLLVFRLFEKHPALYEKIQNAA